MKTLTPRSDAPSTTTRTRVRQLCAAALVVPALALTACSGEAPVTADPTAPAAAATSSTTTAPTTEATTATPTPSATTTKPAYQTERATYKDINVVINDPELGHKITATRLARHLKWPGGQPVGAEQFEIVGVRVRFEAGSRYSATLEPAMLALVAAKPKQTVAPTTEFKGRWDAKELEKADRDETTSGWVFFKVNRGTTTALALSFNRPAYEVSTTDKNIKAKTFTAVLSR